MLKDRGTIKWTSLMLPEHVQLLKQLWQEEALEEMPLLDDQMKEELYKKILNAFESNAFINVKYYEEGKFHTLRDQIRKIDEQRKTLHFHRGMKLAIEQIVSVA